MRSLTPEDLWSIPVPSDPQISPDGSRVAYVLTTPRKEHDDYGSEIWVVDAAGGEARRLTGGPCDSAPRWSPDGSDLAFLSCRDGGPAQIWILPAAGGEARRLTDLAGGAGEARWSPDGERIAFAAPAPGSDPSAPVVADRLDMKADGAGLLRGRVSQVFVVDSSGAAPARQITFGERPASGPVWSPDGERIAFSSPAGTGWDLEPCSVPFVVAAGGGPPSLVGPRGGVYRLCAWSPDGSSLLAAGQPDLDGGHDRLWRIHLDGRGPEWLTPGFDRNVMVGEPGYPGARPAYSSGGERILFCARDRGAVHLMAVGAGGGEPEVLAGGERVVAGASEAAGRICFVAADATSAGEIWLDGRRLTNHFGDALPDVSLIEARSVQVGELHAWMLRAEPDGGPGPLLLDIHGGPHNAWGPAFDTAHLYHQTLAAAGWTVLCVNPRGSDGYGEELRKAVVGAWGRADEGDFLAAVDWAVAKGIADPGRLAVAGYSYGGYMTCWLTARTDRFAAAVAGGCVSDLVSIAGTSDLGYYLAKKELGASVVGPGREALVGMSPLTYAGRVRTPTLILHGEEDQRCPVGQAEEWFAALRQQGVPVQLVRYPGAGHLFILQGRPSHRVDYCRRLERWVTAKTKTPARLRSHDLERRLAEAIGRHRVPGASVAVLAGGEITSAAAGVVNLETGEPARTGTFFQIGSITKVYTATVVMSLAAEGLLDLDSPVVEYLPELQLADPEVTKTVTMRHLLCHTSGIQGDHFPDTGRGDDCIARFVATCSELGQNHPLGATMSYCNTGYVIAGRVIEVLTGQTWDQAMRERLLSRAGLERTVTLPEEVLRASGAVGHVGRPHEPQKVAPVWGLPRCCGPAGLICSTAEDVVRFADMHLRAGEGVLPPSAVEAMQQPQVQVPDPYTLGSHWGLGWILFDWAGRRALGHDGNTIGQSAFLRVVPDRGVALALLTNGGNAGDLYRELFGSLLAELADLELPPRPQPPERRIEAEIDLDRHAGTYERLGVRIEVARRGDELWATVTQTGELAKLAPDPVSEHQLLAVAEDLFVTRQPGTESWVPLVFYRLDDGTPYLHFGARAAPKVA